MPKPVLKNYVSVRGLAAGALGDPGAFSLEQRTFHAICIISVAALVIIAPLNLATRLWQMGIICALAIPFQALLYWVSHFRHFFTLASYLFVAELYVIMVFGFLFDGGLQGPTLQGFFVTYILILAITPKRQQWVWACLHIFTLTILFYVEYHYPSFVVNTYKNQLDQLVDVWTSFVILLICLHLMTGNLLRSYGQEKVLAEKRAQIIEEKNLQLEVLNKEKANLLAIIAHDLRAPLHSIQSYLEVLDTADFTPDERVTIEAGLLELTRHTSEMLQNLLTWSRSQLEGRVVRIRKVNVGDVIGAVLRLFESLATQKNISVQFQPGLSTHACADEDMLQLVVRNLVHNAIKFTREGGRLLVRTEEQNGNVCIYVRDSGVGIAPDRQADIFSGRMTSDSGTRNEKGIGLGLRLCNDLMLLQQGSIAFSSQPDIGSEFVLTLPAWQESGVAVAQTI